ncbi:MAG: hypothetical protein QOE13_1414 [Gaiellaceae bacterium]|jgi:hypothetical protein|nr:hypothetical protein [Gaiellaceae bacterium]
MQVSAQSRFEKSRDRETPALQDFRAALSTFSDDPSNSNLVRYLMASRALEQTRPKVKRARRKALKLAEPQSAT